MAVDFYPPREVQGLTTVLDLFDGVGAQNAAARCRPDLLRPRTARLPGRRPCGGQVPQYWGMACVSERSSSLCIFGRPPAVYDRAQRLRPARANSLIVNGGDLIARNIRPREYLTRKALETRPHRRLIALASRRLHLPAIAARCGQSISISSPSPRFSRRPVPGRPQAWAARCGERHVRGRRVPYASAHLAYGGFLARRLQTSPARPGRQSTRREVNSKQDFIRTSDEPLVADRRRCRPEGPALAPMAPS